VLEDITTEAGLKAAALGVLMESVPSGGLLPTHQPTNQPIRLFISTLNSFKVYLFSHKLHLNVLYTSWVIVCSVLVFSNPHTAPLREIALVQSAILACWCLSWATNFKWLTNLLISWLVVGYL
jgi:hypothetical protein